MPERASLARRLRNAVGAAATASVRLLPADSRIRLRAENAFHYATFVWRHRRLPRSGRDSFNDYLFALKTDGRLQQPHRQHISDKEFCKRHIDETIGPGHRVPTIAVLRSPAELEALVPEAWPVVLKPSHSSGRIAFANDAHQLLALRTELLGWFEHDYYRQSLERNYRGLERKIIVEPVIDDALRYEGSIHCRAGQARVLSIIDRFDEHKRRASSTRDWRPLHVALGQPYRPLQLPRPLWLDELLVKAERLAEAFDYLRVDFYASDERYLFGELTNLPGGALARFSAAFFAP